MSINLPLKNCILKPAPICHVRYHLRTWHSLNIVKIIPRIKRSPINVELVRGQKIPVTYNIDIPKRYAHGIAIVRYKEALIYNTHWVLIISAPSIGAAADVDWTISCRGMEGHNDILI